MYFLQALNISQTQMQFFYVAHFIHDHNNIEYT